MRVLNFYGMSYHFMPKVLDNINNTSTALTKAVEQGGNTIIFFDGAMPEDDTIYNITSEADLRTAYGSSILMEVPNLDFVYTYTESNKKKLIKKMPVDALDTVFTADGTIGWAAIILEDERGLAEDVILFTDSIGQWGDDNMPIIIDKYTGVAGDTNVFKDFSLILRDTSTNEV